MYIQSMTIHRCLQCIYYTLYEAIFNCNFSYIEKLSPTATLVKAESAMWKSNYHNVIANLFKGTTIDYYTISFREETFNTSGNLSTPTWIHNVTKLNVTAHNCAGQSDPVIVYISHGMSYISINVVAFVSYFTCS